MAGWYDDSYQAIVKVYGPDADLFCKLLACTAARASLKSGYTLAKKAYSEIKGGKFEPNGYVRHHRRAIERVIDDLEPKGRKTQAFYRALTGDTDAVVVDRWMLRWYERLGWGQFPRVNGAAYDEIETAVRMHAALVGMAPRDAQAVIWCAERRGEESYADLIAKEDGH